MQEIVPLKEVVRYLQIPLLTVCTYANQGAVSSFRIGNSWRFDKEQIDQVRITLVRGLKKNL